MLHHSLSLEKFGNVNWLEQNFDAEPLAQTLTIEVNFGDYVVMINAIQDV